MIVHLLKLVWSRKGAHVLVMLEVLCSFLVVFALVATAATLVARYRLPLGFDWRDVWVVEIDRGSRWDAWGENDGATFDRLLREVRSLREVEQAAMASNAPYRGMVSVEIVGPEVDAEIMSGSIELDRVLGLELEAGRWFEETDRTLPWRPVVIDRSLARDLFGEADPLGQRMQGEARTERRVVGVVAAFRRGGELAEPRAFAFYPSFSDATGPYLPDSLLLRVTAGTRADFEEQLVERLQSIARGWTFGVRPLAAERERVLDSRLVPLLVAALVGGFLLLMVVLGLVGVMWQNVTRRTAEIGLRRAAGAWRRDIHLQIVAEVVLIAGFGVACGTLLALQAPLLDGSGALTYPVTIVSVVVSGAFVLVLAALCGLYPGWSATRIHPARALHHQ